MTHDCADLITEPHLDAPDAFYESLIQAHQALTEVQSHAYNARLVLLLANHIGALPVLQQALLAAHAQDASAGAEGARAGRD